jgi:hypothetical protein
MVELKANQFLLRSINVNEVEIMKGTHWSETRTLRRNDVLVHKRTGQLARVVTSVYGFDNDRHLGYGEVYNIEYVECVKGGMETCHHLKHDFNSSGIARDFIFTEEQWPYPLEE